MRQPNESQIREINDHLRKRESSPSGWSRRVDRAVKKILGTAEVWYRWTDFPYPDEWY